MLEELLLRERSLSARAAALRPRRVNCKFSEPIGWECCWISRAEVDEESMGRLGNLQHARTCSLSKYVL